MSHSPFSPEQASLDELIHNAKFEQPPSGLELFVLKSVEREMIARKKQRRLVMTMSLGAAAATLGMFLWMSDASNTPTVAPEMAANAASRGEFNNIPPESNDPTSTQALKKSAQVCQKHVVAEGKDPLIDDFEYQGSTPPVREARKGSWEFITDKETGKPGPFYSPTSFLPTQERTVNNQRAMHLKIEHLRDWGASLEYTLLPERCYDASIYSGIRFRAKGGVRLQVAVRQPEIIPEEHGGACTENCYISHLKIIDLNNKWTEYEVPFEQLQKRGYDSKPLETTRIHSLQFSIQSEDTPADVWIDDVAWMK